MRTIEDEVRRENSKVRGTVSAVVRSADDFCTKETEIRKKTLPNTNIDNGIFFCKLSILHRFLRERKNYFRLIYVGRHLSSMVSLDALHLGNNSQYIIE